MRTIQILMLTVAIALGAPQKSDRADAQLQAAINKETVDGDLKSAIEMYKKVAQSSDRAVAAKALVRMGQCYEKLGDAEARKAYERVVRDFADQAEPVRTARGRLSATRIATPAGLTVRQVWTDQDVDASGQISPDGRFLSFVNTHDELAVRDLSTGENRLLTHRTPGGAPDDVDDPVWSPDGKHLAFDFGDYRQIRTINADGTGMRTLFRSTDETAWPEAWSPDGNRILIAQSKGTSRRLSWLNTSDGRAETITPFNQSNKSLNGFTAKAYVSPDGRSIAFGPGHTPNGAREVHLIASDGSGETVLTAHPGGEYPVGWSPDGKQVLFISMRDQASGLWAIPVANGKAQGTAQLLHTDLGAGFLPLGTTRSGVLYYRIETFESDVYTASMDPATGKVTSSPSPLPLARSGRNAAPRWSPDGRRILVTWAQKVRELSILSLDSGKEQPIYPRGELRGSGWCWTDEGASVLTNHELGTAINRVKIASGEIGPAIEKPSDKVFAFSCSANGKLVAFIDASGTVSVRNLDTGSDKEIYRTIANARAMIPEISPDGQTVAFLSTMGGGERAITVVPAAGGSPRELLRVKRPAQVQQIKGLAWSPNGRYVYYLKRSDANAPHELFRIAAAGGPEENMGLKAADIRDINISPDGTRIAFSIGKAQKPEVWAIENFLPATK